MHCLCQMDHTVGSTLVPGGKEDLDTNSQWFLLQRSWNSWIMPALNLSASDACIASQKERMSGSLDRVKACKGWSSVLSVAKHVSKICRKLDSKPSRNALDGIQMLWDLHSPGCCSAVGAGCCSLVGAACESVRWMSLVGPSSGILGRSSLEGWPKGANRSGCARKSGCSCGDYKYHSLTPKVLESLYQHTSSNVGSGMA